MKILRQPQNLVTISGALEDEVDVILNVLGLSDGLYPRPPGFWVRQTGVQKPEGIHVLLYQCPSDLHTFVLVWIRYKHSITCPK